MLDITTQDQPSPDCAPPGVVIPITGPELSLQLCHVDATDPRRATLETMVAAAFHKAYGARIESFYPDLLGFSGRDGLQAVVGYRDGNSQTLFSEQYLDAPVEYVMAQHLQQDVMRHQVAEVGNLALDRPGQARWVIAATTAFLHAAGYRWVLFTAIRNLVNGFGRLGLRPIPLAIADPLRLPDGGTQWGNYYGAKPVVCAGDIGAGLRQIRSRFSMQQPQLRALLDSARLLGSRAAPLTERSAVAAR